jgi:integrase
VHVFAARDGRAFAPTSIYRRANDAWKTAGLNPITLHEARHSCISTRVAAGANIKTVSTLAGHSSVAITLDRYAHLLTGAEDAAMQLVNAYVGASLAPVPSDKPEQQRH